MSQTAATPPPLGTAGAGVDLFGSSWAKILSALTALTLLLGIYLEAVTIWRNLSAAEIKAAEARYSDIKQRAEADEKKFAAALAEQAAANATLKEAADAKTDYYKAEIRKYEAQNAQVLEAAERDLAVANAKIQRAKANAQDRLANAQAQLTEVEAETTALQAEINQDLNTYLTHSR